MNSGGKADEHPKRPTGWRISEELRHRLTSHAEYLSAEAGREITTESMVGGWLEERFRVEDRKRALKTLGITEEYLQGLKRPRQT